ncbi:carboxymuconolactone decarboxylase family protein [Geomobilimonas luticola]|nr:carboxymuconolactone decarboxylase family protein [Geomobilimonas luticola]
MEQCRIKSEKGNTMPLDKKTLELIAIGASVGSGCDD